MSGFRSLLISTLALLGLAACKHEVMPVEPYQSSGQIILDVAKIEIADGTPELGEGQPPRVDHLMNPTLEDLTKNWILSNFRAAGSTGRLVITIKDASVVRSGVPQTVGPFSETVVESGTQLDGRVFLEFRADKADISFASIFNSVAVYSLPLPDKTDVEDRMQGEAAMKNALFWELDKQVTNGILNYLDPLIIR